MKQFDLILAHKRPKDVFKENVIRKKCYPAKLAKQLDLVNVCLNSKCIIKLIQAKPEHVAKIANCWPTITNGMSTIIYNIQYNLR